jgi:ABC-type transport system involved in cytochrome bd biosynthesis fused ATPase/permease subunit
MNSYIFFLKLYLKFSRRSIAAAIYRQASTPTKLTLWTSKAVFAGAAMLHFVVQNTLLIYFIILCSAITWAVSFEKARQQYFRLIPNFNRDYHTHFTNGYQYIRYLLFKQAIQNTGRTQEASEVISFINNLHETEFKRPVFSHPVVATLLAVILAIIGGKTADWPTGFIVPTIMLAIFGIYISAMILSVHRPKEADTKELRRFLHWLASGE